MSREIKRVPMDFEWPLNKVWAGFLMPDEYPPIPCRACDETGYNRETKQIDDDFYDFAGTGSKWCYSVTQDEVQALIDANRLYDFTRVPRNDEQREVVKKKMDEGGNSWLPYDNGYIPTADEVNDWNRNGFGHDSINKWILIETRAKRLGVFGNCPNCNGEGHGWRDDTHKKLYDEWKETPVPTGDGWQMWETTSEGSPISPVFDTPEKLARWLTDNNASAFARQGATYEQWLNMCKAGWAISAVSSNKGLQSGVAALSN